MLKKLLIAATLAALLPTTSEAWAQAPGLIPIQGFLSDAAGNPLTGSRTLVFALYPSEGASTALFTQSFSINTPDGAFAVVLGSSQPLDLSEVPEDGSLWLGLSVDGGAELTPRLQFGAAPYAARSEFANDAATVQGLGVEELSTAAAEAVATADQFVRNTGDTVDGTLEVVGDMAVRSAVESDGLTAPLIVEDTTFDDALVVDSDEIDSTSVIGLRINTNSRQDTRVGSNVIGGTVEDFEDEEAVLTRIFARVNEESTVQSISTELLESYCGDEDGCKVIVVERGFDSTQQDLRRSAGPVLFMYENATGRWTVGDGTITGTQNEQAREIIVTTGLCRFEEDVPLGTGGQIDFGFSNITADGCSFSIED